MHISERPVIMYGKLYGAFIVYGVTIGYYYIW